MSMINLKITYLLLNFYEGFYKKRVLIVDDDSKSRRLFEAHLASMGFETVLANDGEEAMEILAGDLYCDLIITDVMMPYMSGFDFTKELKKYKIMVDYCSSLTNAAITAACATSIPATHLMMLVVISDFNSASRRSRYSFVTRRSSIHKEIQRRRDRINANEKTC